MKLRAVLLLKPLSTFAFPNRFLTTKAVIEQCDRCDGKRISDDVIDSESPQATRDQNWASQGPDSRIMRINPASAGRTAHKQEY